MTATGGRCRRRERVGKEERAAAAATRKAPFWVRC
jgi:hypothetical protein